MLTNAVGTTRMTGAVRHLAKGHGYIAGDDGVNYYLHWTAMRPDSTDFRQLRVRERVNFSIVPNAKKEATPRAIDVYVVSIDSSNHLANEEVNHA